MRYNTLLKITRDLGPWYSKIFNTFFQKSGQAVITSYIALQHVTKGYNGFRTLVTNYKVVQIFWNVFFQKSGQAVITRYNALYHVTKGYKKIETLVTNCE